MQSDHTQSSWQIDENQYALLDNDSEKLTFLLQYAILAPSMHNTQPWSIKLNEDEIIVTPDDSRMLAIGDYDQRGYFFSVGCMLENLSLAGHKYGWDFSLCDIKGKTIHIRIAKTRTNDPKFSLEGILLRHTNRSSYQNKALPKSFIDLVNDRKLKGVSALFLTGSTKNKMARYMVEGTRMTLQRKDFRDELSGWMRSSKGHHHDGMPMHVFNFPKMLSYIVKYLIPHLKKSADQASKQDYITLTEHTKTLILITTKTDTAVDWVQTGRLFQYVSVVGAEQGIYLHPMYATVYNKELRAQVIKEFCNGDKVQFVSRIGFPKEMRPHTPRKNVEAFITNTKN